MRKRSTIIGAMITAGTSVGAGMFSLPVVSSGMWFIFSMLSLIALWYLSYLSAMYLLESNMQFEPGASFDTMVAEILGKHWNILTGIAIAFMFYILLYAYFSAFGSMVATFVDSGPAPQMIWIQRSCSLLFGSILATIVWFSTRWVGRLSTVLVVGLAASFVLAMSGLAVNIDASKLLRPGADHLQLMPYIWSAWPYYITSFGFASVIPSLYKFYGKDPAIIRKSLLMGSFFALLVYCLFVFVCFGNLSRSDFVSINASGGNIGVLIQALSGAANGSGLSVMLTTFSNFAITSSFLGVGLGLFDYIADKFKFADDQKSRFFVACITFVPPGLASFLFPDGFIAAIGFAGLVLIYSFFLLPYLMVVKVRNMKRVTTFRVAGGKVLLNLFLVVSLLVVVFHILSMLNYLPTW